MRIVETVQDRDRAERLSDALEVEGIENEVRAEDDGFGIWVIDDRHLDAAARIVAQAGSSAGAEARAAADRIRREREAAARPVRVPGLGQRGVAAAGPAGALTVCLIGVCVAVALFSRLGADSSVVRMLSVVPVSAEGYYYPSVDWTQPWRLLTPMFIHFGLLHLVFNMLWLYRLGSQVEAMQGPLVLAGLVALTQVPGTVVQLSMTGPWFGGMSGVVYGLFGYTWMQARYGAHGYALSERDTLWIMGWFVVCATGLVGRIANAQHALGLCFGLLAAMPTWIAFARSSASVSFERGSWADLNIRGAARFRRLYFEPYVPLWFLALAAGVLWWG